MRSRRAPRGARTVKDPESAEAAYQEAVKRLARQPQSRAMLGQRLRHAGFTEEAITAGLGRAEADGYLDDREFAASLVRRRAGARGTAMIAQELRAKGIGKAAAEPALAQVDHAGELDHALKLGRSLVARRQFADGEALLSYVAPRLARRGFGSGISYRVCRLLASEWQTPDLV